MLVGREHGERRMLVGREHSERRILVGGRIVRGEC